MQILDTLDAVITDLEKNGITRYSKALHGVFVRLASDYYGDGDYEPEETDDDRYEREDQEIDEAHDDLETLLIKFGPSIQQYCAMPPGPEKEALMEKIYNAGDEELIKYKGAYDQLYNFPYDADQLLTPLFDSQGDVYSTLDHLVSELSHR